MTVLVTTALMTSFRTELFQAIHNATLTTGHTFKIALIKASPGGTYTSPTITNYGAGSGSPTTSNLGTDEASGTGYSAGGFNLSGTSAANNLTPVASGTQGCTKWNVDPNWTGATITTIGAEIYNASASNKAVSLHDLTGGTGTAVSVTSGTLTLVQGAQTAGNAPIQI